MWWKLPDQNLSKVSSELSINVFFTVGQLQKKIPMNYETSPTISIYTNTDKA